MGDWQVNFCCLVKAIGHQLHWVYLKIICRVFYTSTKDKMRKQVEKQPDTFMQTQDTVKMELWNMSPRPLLQNQDGVLRAPL